MKKLIYSVFILLFLIASFLSIRYALNEVYITRYSNSNYDNGILNYLLLINYPEPYIAHYNKGNNYYNLEDYDSAISEYNESLKTVKGERKCKVIVNLSLASLQKVDLKSKSAVNDLKGIQGILLEDDCATEDNKGKDDDAQELYNEIEELLNSQSSSPQEPDDDEDDDDDDDKNEPQDEYKELEDKLKQQQQQASAERNKVNSRDYEYYSGKKW